MCCGRIAAAPSIIGSEGIVSDEKIKMKNYWIPAVLVGAAALCGGTAHAQQTIAPGLTISGEVAVVSDYRFRGLSYTDRKAAVQPQATISHKSGLYANVFVSSLPKTDALGTVELDFTGGWTHALSKNGTLDMGLAYYTYPRRAASAPPIDYAETYVRYSHVVGPVTATASAYYAPRQTSLSHRENFNLGLDVQYSLSKSPVALNAHLGRSAGAWAPNGEYLDWSLGATVTLKHVKLGLSYVDTDVPRLDIAKPTLLASARLTF